MKTLLLDAFIAQMARMGMTLPDPRPGAKVVDLGVSMVCAEKPKQITAAIEWLDEQQQDWSADYRIFSQTQWQPNDMLRPLFRQAVCPENKTPKRVFLGQDDTLLPKTGKKIPGVSYARHPQSPPFQVNLVKGQRFVQTCLLLQPGGDQRPWRSIPIQFTHAPVPKVPRNASPEQEAAIKEVRKKHRLSVVAVGHLAHCRKELDALPGGRESILIDAVDGGYSNCTYFGRLPERCEAVARFRKDAKLRAYLPPEERKGARKYGLPLPTPLEMLQDPVRPWQTTDLFIAGQMRTLSYKEITGVCWPKATKTRPVRIILIKAAGYRLFKGGKLLYREPAFLITTDLTTPAAVLISAYIARWEVEVNFRDEKTLLGVGQAQVRNPNSVERAPFFLVACYAALLFCCISVFGDQRTADFGPLPKWRKQPPLRPSTRDLIRRLRKEAADYPSQRAKLNPLCRN
jgi:hypothetical protein